MPKQASLFPTLQEKQDLECVLRPSKNNDQSFKIVFANTIVDRHQEITTGFLHHIDIHQKTRLCSSIQPKNPIFQVVEKTLGVGCKPQEEIQHNQPLNFSTDQILLSLSLYLEIDSNQQAKQLSNPQNMKRVIIEAEYVIIECFIGLKQHLFHQLSLLNSSHPLENNQTAKKIVFLIQNLQLSEYSAHYDHLRAQFPGIFKKFYINILMTRNSKDIQEHLNHIRKVNQPTFEQNYLQLQEHSEAAIQQDIVQNYLLGKLKWNTIKSKYFVQKNRINSIKELMQYKAFPFFEKTIINKTISFLQFCKSQLAKKQESR